MAIIRRNPLTLLPRWFEDWDWDTPFSRGLRLHETDNELVVEAVVAGVPAEKVEVNIENGVITIKAETKEEEKEKGLETYSSYRYYYTTSLIGGQWDKTKAEVKNGVLTLTIPKATSAKPQKIKVETKG